MEVDWRDVGRRIRQARKKLDWTQELLAEKADSSTSFLGHIERGTHQASADTLYRLCQQLRISMDSLFPTQENSSNPSLGKSEREKALELLKYAIEIATNDEMTH
ncbi:MAG: helix-turn-helix transcriptional regulator [Eubacteriales bacterium]|nr:helix-turn-helix transcriptional regulator [Eubacteriales bacterium]